MGEEEERWGGFSQSVSQSSRGKEHQNGRRALARCLCTEKNQASEDHSAPFTFWDHLGCSNLGDTWVTTATHADIEELVRLRQFQKKKTACRNTPEKHHFMCNAGKWFRKSPGSPGETMRGDLGSPRMLQEVPNNEFTRNVIV